MSLVSSSFPLVNGEVAPDDWRNKMSGLVAKGEEDLSLSQTLLHFWTIKRTSSFSAIIGRR